MRSNLCFPGKSQESDAREWALCFIPELAYFFGLTIQVFQGNRLSQTGLDPKLPLEFAKHGRCLREGVDNADKLALRQIVGGLMPRVVVHRRYSELKEYLKPGPPYESSATIHVRYL